MKELFLKAPSGQIDKPVMDTISEWDDIEPTALQILKTLDIAVFYAGASQIAVNTLDLLLLKQLNKENISFEQLTAQAEWRKDL